MVILMLLFYGFYLLRCGFSGMKTEKDLFIVRHQITWPLLLVIGVPLYVGARLADSQITLAGHIAISHNRLANRWL